MGKLIIKDSLSECEHTDWNRFICEAQRSPAYCSSSLSAWCDFLAGSVHVSLGNLRFEKKPWFMRYFEDSAVPFAQGIIYSKGCGALKNSFLELHGLTVGNFEEQRIRNFLNELMSFAASVRAISSTITYPNLREANAKKLAAILREIGFHNACSNHEDYWFDTRVIDLSDSEDQILHSFRDATRRQIRRAKKVGTEIKIGNQKEDIDMFYKLFSLMWQNKGIKVPLSRGYFEKIAPCMTVITALSPGAIPLAVAAILEDGSTARYRWGAADGETNGAAALVHFEAILWAKRKGLKFYDIGGIPNNPDNKFLKGIKQFKEGFRGQKVSLLEPHTYTYRPLLYHIYSSVRDMKQRVRSFVTLS